MAAQQPLTFEQAMEMIMEYGRQADLRLEMMFQKFREEDDLRHQKEQKEREEKELKLQKEREAEELKRQEERAAEERRREAEELKRQKELEASEKAWKESQKESQKYWNKRFSEFTDRIGEIIEAMVEGNIVGKFRKLGYKFTKYHRRVGFTDYKLDIDREVDLFLEDGDVALLIEVKTKLETADVRKHIQRLEDYRRYADARVDKDKRRFIGAVAGAVADKEAIQFAHDNGMYVIVQSGEAVKILKSPKGFQPRNW